MWSYDFVFDWSANGQQLESLTVRSTNPSKEGLAIEVDGRIRSNRVIEVLSATGGDADSADRLPLDKRAGVRLPRVAEVDRRPGPRFALIDPGKPWQNGSTESFSTASSATSA